MLDFSNPKYLENARKFYKGEHVLVDVQPSPELRQALCELGKVCFSMNPIKKETP